MIEEVFRDIPNYIGLYQVSNMGSVKSFKRIEPILLKHYTNPNGYNYVDLYKDKQKLKIAIHKLMQSTFDMGGGCIDHINGVRCDNRLENLRIVTSRENSQNKVCHRQGKLVGTSLRNKGRNLKKPWQSAIKINGKRKSLGYFATELEAHQTYMAKCKLLDEF